MTKARSQSRRAPRTSRWLACFTFERPRTKGIGSFQMVVDAATPNDVMARCHARLERLRQTTRLFDKPTAIYVDRLLRLDGRLPEGVLVNWQTNTSDGRISNIVPDPDADGVEVFEPRGGGDEPFIAFGDVDGYPSDPPTLN